MRHQIATLDRYRTLPAPKGGHPGALAWTAAEEATLVARRQELLAAGIAPGVADETIATELGRTKAAISARLDHLAKAKPRGECADCGTWKPLADGRCRQCEDMARIRATDKAPHVLVYLLREEATRLGLTLASKEFTATLHLPGGDVSCVAVIGYVDAAEESIEEVGE